MTMEPESNTKRNLIRQNARDELITEFEEMKKNNLLAEQQRKIELHEEHCKKSLVRLSRVHFGISEEQIFGFDERKFRALEGLLDEQTRWSDRAGKLLFAFLDTLGICTVLGIPLVVAQFCAEERPGLAWKYRHNRSRLKKIYGEDYSLYKKFGKHGMDPS